MPKKGAAELAHYALTFPCVEINTSFHGLPTEETFKKWKDSSPKGFRFAVKAPGKITHEKAL